MPSGIIRHRIEGLVDPAAAFSALYATSPTSFWLDSGIDADSGMSFLGAGSTVATSSVADGTVTLSPANQTMNGTIFDFLLAQPTLASTGGFPLGWIGWLGYELRSQTQGTRGGVAVDGGARRSRHPDAALIYVDRLLAYDHRASTFELVALGDDWDGALGTWRRETVAALGRAASVGDLQPRAPAATGRAQPVATWHDSDEQYLRSILACQAAIHEGEAYQLCLTTEVAVDVRPDPLATWLTLRRSSPSHHGAFLRIGEVSLLSSSPEQFLTVSRGGVVESKPIKGTRPRGATLEEDKRLRNELVSSEKERAENLMIVDLMRNDIGRVSEIGSVSVPSLLSVESYAQVHQLVSTVRGRLADGLHAVDAVVACFPAGSMTGAPKLRATEILDAIEQRARGIYSGAFGYFALDGTIDLAMVIRSIVLDEVGATIGTGGGITASSVPEEELAEIKLKAAALLAVLGVEEAPLGR